MKNEVKFDYSPLYSMELNDWFEWKGRRVEKKNEENKKNLRQSDIEKKKKNIQVDYKLTIKSNSYSSFYFFCLFTFFLLSTSKPF